MRNAAFLLWRRLDVPGHDACRLSHVGQRWELDDVAVFRHFSGRVAQLHDRVRCDGAWHTG